ncbi:SWIM zinc finger family protein [Salinibaculum rarum]|uniref:SWIM zinc finger family protein n=1 Tax=Salinibaculum rarum TaxID=3058903 RepID=UPI00265D760D|nr:SWIM zinc finger family protein [Salinibaculum sp. KK48]
MTIDEATIHELCTNVVFERGQTYREEGRIRQLDRFGKTVTARVQGTELYETRVHLDSDEFDPHCTCPYSGPGECKHVVAVLLAVADEMPDDESKRIDDLLADISTENLRTFVSEELTRDPEMRERFLAEFGDEPTVTPGEYRQEVDRLFDQHTQEYPVVTGAIDFSHLTDLAERYRENDNYEQAAAVYRGLSEGIAEHMNIVDGAYDHYSQTFQSALDGYVECISTADLNEATVEEHAEYLETRVDEAVDYLARRYEKALDDLESGE